MVDLCLEHTDRQGNAPDSITTVQLAEKVLELYWPHTSPFVPGGPHELVAIDEATLRRVLDAA